MFSANSARLLVYGANIWRKDDTTQWEYDRLALPLLISAPNESADFYLFRLLSLMSVVPLNFPLLQQSFSSAGETLPFTLTQALKTNSIRHVRSSILPMCRFGELDIERSCFVRIGRDPASGASVPGRKEFPVDRALVQAVIAADTLWKEIYDARLAEERASSVLLHARSATLEQYESKVRYMYALAHGSSLNGTLGVVEFLQRRVQVGLGVGMRLFAGAYHTERGLERYAEAVTAYTLITMAARCVHKELMEHQRTMHLLHTTFAPVLQGVMSAYSLYRSTAATLDAYSAAAVVFRYYAQEASLRDISTPSLWQRPAHPVERGRVQPVDLLGAVMPPATATALPADTDGMDVAINAVAEEYLTPVKSKSEKQHSLLLHIVQGKWQAVLYYFCVLKALGERSFYYLSQMYSGSKKTLSLTLTDVFLNDFDTVNPKIKMDIIEYVCAWHAMGEPTPPKAGRQYNKVLQRVLASLDVAKRTQVELLHRVNEYSALSKEEQKAADFPLPANPNTLTIREVADLLGVVSTQQEPSLVMQLPMKKPELEARTTKRKQAESMYAEALLAEERRKRAQYYGPIVDRALDAVATQEAESGSAMSPTTIDNVVSSSSSGPPRLSSTASSLLFAPRNPPPPPLSFYASSSSSSLQTIATTPPPITIDDVARLLRALATQLERYGHCLCLGGNGYAIGAILGAKLTAMGRPLSPEVERLKEHLAAENFDPVRTDYIKQALSDKQLPAFIVALLIDEEAPESDVCVGGLATLIGSVELARKVLTVFSTFDNAGNSYWHNLESAETTTITKRKLSAFTSRQIGPALSAFCDGAPTSAAAYTYGEITNDIRFVLTSLYKDTLPMFGGGIGVVTRMYDVRSPHAEGARAVHKLLQLLVTQMKSAPDTCGAFDTRTDTAYMDSDVQLTEEYSASQRSQLDYSFQTASQSQWGSLSQQSASQQPSESQLYSLFSPLPSLDSPSSSQDIGSHVTPSEVPRLPLVSPLDTWRAERHRVALRSATETLKQQKRAERSRH